jgi:hypothetical protein
MRALVEFHGPRDKSAHRFVKLKWALSKLLFEAPPGLSSRIFEEIMRIERSDPQ